MSGGGHRTASTTAYKSIHLDVESPEERKTPCIQYIRSYDANEWDDYFIFCNILNIPVVGCQVFSLVFLIAMIAYVFVLCMSSVVHEKVVKGPPFIYVTTHGNDNIFKYSRDGSLITDKVLKHAKKAGLGGMRMMSFGIYDDKNKNALFVATPDNPDQIAIYGDCAAEKSALGQRTLLATHLRNGSSTGAIHSYGISINPGKALFVSFQDTGVVLRLDPQNNYAPFTTLPMDLRPLKHGKEYYNGTIYQSNAENYDLSDDIGFGGVLGVRGIVAVDDTLWVANEISDKVLIINQTTGAILHKVDVPNPIGLYYDEMDENVYIASYGKYQHDDSLNSTGKVAAYWKVDYSLNNTYEDPNGFLVHPTSVARYENTLYIAEQTTNSIMTFDVTSGTYTGTLFQIPFK